MRTIHLSIPGSVDKNDNELVMIIASKLYKEKWLTYPGN